MKIDSYFTLFSALVLVCILSSCNKSMQNRADIARSISLPDNGARVIQAGDQFAFDFLHSALQTDQTLNNKLISPLSIYLALSMTCNGAANATRDSIQNALRAYNLSIEDLNTTCQALIQGIPLVDNRVTLSIANSIWYRQNIQPLESFLNTTNEYYQAKIDPLNFDDPQAVNTINQWVADNTRQKITHIIDKIDGADLMYLINAIYFKGSWKYQFDPAATTDHIFNLATGNSISTPFMAIHSNINYFQNDSLQMLQLPYGGGNFNMYVLLPANSISLPDFTAALNSSSFNYWQSQLNPRDIELGLPKFKYSYSIDSMKPALTEMGMGLAFGDRADFSNMYSNIPAYISKAIHKTYIEVDENGTEAAAVTAVGIAELTDMPAPIIVDINHPFVYIIQEKTSGSILFIGLLNNPTQG